MKRTLLPFLALCCALLSQAQVQLDRPLVLDAADPTQRRIEGLAPATIATELITVDGARSGSYHWATASGTPTDIALTMQPVCAAYTKGLVIRFLASAPAVGAITLNVDGLGAKRLLRSDGLGIPFGQIQSGVVVEAIYADTAFILNDRAFQGCPPGFLQANTRLCVMQRDTLSMSIFNASSWCMDRGAKLCTWDEYIHACTVTAGAFLDFADNWEWIDDTSDHTHTAVQVGRWNCASLQTTGALESPNNLAPVRCCYHLR